MKPSREISRLIEIMAALREPDTGCPWDIEQDFKSIAPYTIEEVYEVIDAIERDDRDDLREELGDLLLQVIYHSQMATEEGAFDFGDVVEGITTKMIRRHPHVFGSEEARSAGMAKGAWERIKAIEKAEQAERRAAMGLPPKGSGTSRLDDVPNVMPGLMVALKLQQKASKVGFDWNDPRAVLAKIREEIDEAEAELDAGDAEKLTDEIGDILFAVANLARHANIDPDQALRRSNAKFRKRFAHIENALGERLDEADLDEMEKYWVEAKGE
ncbi:nucleoside triphosphate pyrophosphohydrolase [Pseudahrensia aquimaris]|uniref:Nucleoside triphosphate pyrophosphohydrolase n=1 Tax=Pseudahrensia aquimaris TaxID=744461 RepID=A0ABW3FI08_9HYPH